MNWAIISLIGLIAIIVLANFKNINAGFLGLAFAMCLGTLGGLEVKDIYTNFDLQIFLRMMGMQVLIVIAKSNGTIDIIGNAVLKVARGKNIRLLPIVIYFAIGLATWFQLGLSQVLTPLVFAIAYELKLKDPLKLGFVTFFGLYAWGVSPFSMQGLNLATYAAEQGYTLNLWAGAFNSAIMGTLLFLGMYFFYGWHKMEPVHLDNSKKVEIGRKQILTLLGFLTFIVLNLFVGVDMMITPICAAVVLLCLGCADPDMVVKNIGWSTLIMIGGMTVYVGIIVQLGGVDLLSSMIASVANATIAPAIMTFICGIMSTFSSGNGVVIPTMTSTISDLAAAIPGLDIASMFLAVNIGASSTAISPMSTIGANAMSYYTACYNPSPQDEKKTFNKLFVLAGVFMVWAMISTVIGITSLIK